jgi:hypothetical protein
LRNPESENFPDFKFGKGTLSGLKNEESEELGQFGLNFTEILAKRRKSKTWKCSLSQFQTPKK